jgi:hypothetical protein
LFRVALPRQHGLDNRYSRRPGNIAADVRPLDVHLLERFLHVLNVDCCHLHETLAMAPKGPESPDGLRGAVGGAEKAYSMEVWPPLAIGDVGLAARHVFHMTGVDQAHPAAAVFPDLKERNPENARGLQRHGFHAARLEPIGQLLKFPGESTEVTDRRRIAIRGNRHLNLRCSDIDSGRVGFQHSG